MREQLEKPSEAGKCNVFISKSVMKFQDWLFLVIPNSEVGISCRDSVHSRIIEECDAKRCTEKLSRTGGGDHLQGFYSF